MRYVYIWLLDEGRVKSYRYGLRCYNNTQQGQFGTEFSFYLLFYKFPLFSEIFINIDKCAN